jgi:hypothetical protein
MCQRQQSDPLDAERQIARRCGRQPFIGAGFREL